MELILASTSPYRRTLLERLAIPFAVVAPPLDEAALKYDGLAPAELAVRLALAKAESVARLHPAAIVIGSDQVADCEGARLDKPGSRSAAIEQLRFLAGRSHRLWTAVAITIGPAPRAPLARPVTRTTSVAARPDGSAANPAESTPANEKASGFVPTESYPTDRMQSAHRPIRADSSGPEGTDSRRVRTIDSAPASVLILDRTTLVMRRLTDTEIVRYVDADEPFDCAGSYKFEARGIGLFDRIDTSDPTAIIGLPLMALHRVLRSAMVGAG